MTKIKIKRIEKVPITEERDGKVVYNMGADAASADPRAYRRLVKAGKLKEAQAMMNEPMYRVTFEERK